MPEKMTEEEARISRAIRLVRKAKEVLQQEGRETLPLEIENSDVKTKKPKAEKDDTNIENNTGTHSGYGLAGETFGKSDITIKGAIEMLNEGIKGERLTYGKYKDPQKVEKFTRMINRLKKLPKLIEDGHWTKGEEAGVKAILQEETMLASAGLNLKDTFGKADTYTDAYMPSANRIADRINTKLEEILDEFRNDNTAEIAERMYGEKKIEEMSETIYAMRGTISRFNSERRAED